MGSYMFSLLSLLDDIASTLDDIAIMTKVAIKDTTALMSDDLAVNTAVVHGVNADKELPMVWKIFVGSLLNKVYCILGVLILMATYPPLLKVILVFGGIYLSYEGAHKVFEKLFHKEEGKAKRISATVEQRVKGAIRTDLILSIEIIVIAHSGMKGTLLNQTLSLCVVGVLVSIIIYGLVAILVKIDDFGLILVNKGYKKFGNFLVQSMPVTMKGLGVVGTIAMFLVGGGIITHIFHLPVVTIEIVQNFVIGIIVGSIAVGIISLKSIFVKEKIN
jgi:predicted DNA repair protein MutK